MNTTPAQSDFLAVARTIAKGEPPQWLLIGLNHFSKLIRLKPKIKSKEDREIDQRMLEAAKYLSKWLPSYLLEEHGFEEFGFEIPDCVETVLRELPEVIELLEEDIRDAPTGAIVQRKICAAVVVESWRMIHGHGEVGPRRELVQQACNEYWRACGCEEIGATGDIENWRRPLESALEDDPTWIRSILLAIQNPSVQNPS
jgi:hypothetical protein